MAQEPFWYKGEQIGIIDRTQSEIRISPLLDDHEKILPSFEPGDVLKIKGSTIFGPLGKSIGQLGPGNTFEPGHPLGWEEATDARLPGEIDVEEVAEARLPGDVDAG